MTDNHNGYSARVRLQLVVAGQTLEVAQVLEKTCYLRQTLDHPPCEAELVIAVDDQVRRKRVFLDRGLSRESSEVVFSSCKAAAR